MSPSDPSEVLAIRLDWYARAGWVTYAVSMPKSKDFRPVAFFDLSEELSRGDLDAAVEKVMRVIRERSQERKQVEDGDSAHGRRGPGEPREPIPIPLADTDRPLEPPQDR